MGCGHLSPLSLNQPHRFIKEGTKQKQKGKVRKISGTLFFGTSPVEAVNIVIRLFFAGLLGAFIGLEREAHGRPAGLRTHILVSLGSCLVMLISIYGFRESANSDPARLAAQVVSGIGFLGAGTILREGATVRGLTTAASLWVVSGIGLGVGSGFYLGAIITTIFSIITLTFLENIEIKYFSTEGIIVEGVMEDRPGQLASFCKVFADYGLDIKNIKMEIDEEKKQVLISLRLKGQTMAREEILAKLSTLPGLTKINWR